MAATKELMTPRRALALALLLLEAEVPAALRTGQRRFAKECMMAIVEVRKLKEELRAG